MSLARGLTHSVAQRLNVRRPWRSSLPVPLPDALTIDTDLISIDDDEITIDQEQI